MGPARRSDNDSYDRRTAEKLQDLGKRFRAVVQSATDAIVLVDARGEIRLWNAAAERMFGWTDAEALGRPFATLFAERLRPDVEERLRRRMDEPNERAESPLETIAVDRHGNEIPVEAALSGFVSGRGRFVSAIVRDVRERKEADERLRTALARAQESDRLKSAFLDNVSHEIRTPINVIVGNAEILADHLRALGDDSLRPSLDAMHRAGKRLVDAVGRVLDYARISAGELAPRRTRVRLPDLVRMELDDLASLAKEKGLALECEIGEPSLAVYADGACLARALANLVDNAIKFTEHGSVRVRIDRDSKGRVLVEVRDTGIGIEPWFLDRLFEPFMQEEVGDKRHYEGNGLGLAVSRRYVELAGGSIEVESEKGKGSCFRIVLPAPARPARADGTVVVACEADPEPPWLAGLASVSRVRVEKGAEAARSRLENERHRAAGLVLSLGLGESGFALGRALREDPWWWNLPIVGVVPPDEEWGRGRALAAGFDELVAESATAEEILFEISRPRAAPSSDPGPARASE